MLTGPGQDNHNLGGKGGTAMCLAVYIASDRTPPIAALDQAWPALCVEDMQFFPDNPVRRHLSKPFIYSAGPRDGGCGCAFLFSVINFKNDEGEYVEVESPDRIALVRGLANFLSAALQHQAAVEVFTCCSGDESFPPEHRRARPMDFIWDRTLFRFGELALVSEQDTAPTAVAARGV
jgi:hypothetical protein